jgi:PPOX class probable F420-dependent enzyme
LSFESLQGRFALLTTWRKNGNAVTTPVWVVVDDGKAFVVSRGPGKVKRIRANPKVEIGPATMRGRPRGDAQQALGHVVPGAIPPSVRRAFRRKYGPLPAVGRLAARAFRKELVLLEIAPSPA